MELPYVPVILLLGVYLKKIKIEYQKDIYTSMFIAALFTTVKIQKQLNHLSMDEWVKKMYIHIYAMEYYLAVRKKKILTFATTWMGFQGIMLKFQTEKDKYCMLSLTCGN